MLEHETFPHASWRVHRSETTHWRRPSATAHFLRPRPKYMTGSEAVWASLRFSTYAVQGYEGFRAGDRVCRAPFSPGGISLTSSEHKSRGERDESPGKITRSELRRELARGIATSELVRLPCKHRRLQSSTPICASQLDARGDRRKPGCRRREEIPTRRAERETLVQQATLRRTLGSHQAISVLQSRIEAALYAPDTMAPTASLGLAKTAAAAAAASRSEPKPLIRASKVSHRVSQKSLLLQASRQARGMGNIESSCT